MPDERINFCVCSLMGNAYVSGGYIQQEIINSCLMFNAADCSWKEVAKMNISRSNASCTVFEGKIVVSGGYNNGLLNTVEAYDHIANEWTNMLNMVEERCDHKSVAVKNKLFIVGGNTTTCEVYDSGCGKFSSLKLLKETIYGFLRSPSEVLSIENKLLIFKRYEKNVLIYDIEKDDWSEKPCSLIQNRDDSCVKVPQF